MALVSVIITTHERPQLLPRAVESAWAAGKDDIEVVVVDDASTDDTARVCRSLPNICYVRVDRNQGVAGARNLGIIRSTGEYLCFLDDDDVRLAGSLDDQLAILRSHANAAMIYGQAILGEHDGSPTDRFYPAQCPQGDIFWELLTHNFIPAGTALFRRSALLKVGLLDDECPGVDDWDLWVRLAEMFPVVALERPVMVWRQASPSSKQGSSKAREMVRMSRVQFRKSWQRLPRFVQGSADQQRKSRQGFSNTVTRHLLWETYRAAQQGELRIAQKNLASALRDHPLETARVVLHPASFRRLSSEAGNHRQVTRSTVRSII